jgi:hypothetical protein
MTAGEEVNSDDAQFRIDVELFLVHPSLTPAQISAALGLEGHRTFRVGDPRKTPKGTPLPGRYARTSWRHSIRYDLRDQRFADKIATLVDRLMPHREFLRRVRATDGRAMVIVQFLGDGYLGDEVPLDTLSKMVELQLEFGIECFAVPQA